MTRGTIYSYNPTRGTGTLTSLAGTVVPFSTRRVMRHQSFCEGAEVTYRLTGGRVGLYADRVQPCA